MRSSVKMPRVVPAKYAEIVTTAAANAKCQVSADILPVRERHDVILTACSSYHMNTCFDKLY